METDAHLVAVETVKAELGSAMAATKCHRCGCYQDAVLGFSRSTTLTAYLADLITEAQTLFEEKRYDCLGCETCWPAVASNAAAEIDPALADASCCATAEPVMRDGWPPLPGDYRVLRFHAPVAVCTLNSDELVGRLTSMQPPGLAIVGTLHTENLGIEHLIRNLLPNPNVRFLVVCGEDTRKAIGHLPGQSLLSLMSHGLDDQGRILQASGKRPVLKNVSREHVEAFRRRIEVINLLGETDLERIAECIAGLASRNPGPSDDVLSDAAHIPIEEATEPTRLIPDPAGYFVLYSSPPRYIYLCFRQMHWQSAQWCGYCCLAVSNCHWGWSRSAVDYRQKRFRHEPIHTLTFLLTSNAGPPALFGPWRCKRLSAPKTKQTTCPIWRIKMQVSKLIVALTIAAGFATTSFAQGITAPAPQVAPTAKAVAPAPATAEKKVEAPKAAEPAKVEAAKPETPKADAGKPAEKHGKAKAKGHEHKDTKHEMHEKGEAKPAAAPATK